ncbi:MAG: DUF2911 domain-containing protein [Anditalea sp.]
MKKSNTLLMALLLGGLLGINGCGEKKSETAEGEDETGVSSSEEKASPLKTSEGKIGNTTVKVQYGAPSVKDRVIWGDLVPYNEVWRTGANEATFVEFSDDVMVEGEALEAGKYSLFTIPREDGDWTVIFNSEWDLEHGHYQYKEENDVLRIEVSPQWEETSQENLSVNVEGNGLLVRWEKASLPIKVQ